MSRETQEAAPEMPWAAMASMRHRLIHGYFDVDPDIVWRTATEEIPVLVPRLQALVVAD